MAAFPPGAGVPQPPDPTAAQNKTFTEYYNDASNDEFRGDYTTVMATFASPGVGNVQPVTIRDLISNDPHRSSMGYAVLVVSASNPNQPGLIYGIRSASMPPVSASRRLLGTVNSLQRCTT
jgi:hypothetical protein